MTTGTGVDTLFEIQVETRGELPRGVAERARTKVFALLDGVRRPVLFARIRLMHVNNPASERPYLAQVNADLSGRMVRAHLAAASADEAVDLVCDRVKAQLARLSDLSARNCGRSATPRDHGEVSEHEWRHGSVPTQRPDWFPRPVEEREVVRHKSFALPRETPDEAAFEMDLMDYDFHLFTDLETGEDCLVHRSAASGASGGQGFRLAQVSPHPEVGAMSVAPMTVSSQPAPVMDLPSARRRLEALGDRFVFFADDRTGRGNVLYHRYDGHYGLITPAG